MITRDDALAHFGIPGMRWGKRKSPMEEIQTRAKANTKLKRKLASTKLAVAKTNLKVAKYKARLEKSNGIGAKSLDWLFQDFGWSVAKSNGRKFGKHSTRAAKMNGQIAKIELRIIKNKEVMSKKVKELSPEELKTGKELVQAMLKED